MEALKNPLALMIKYFQDQCRTHPHAGLNGFKLKPYFKWANTTAGEPEDPKWAFVMHWLRNQSASILYSHSNRSRYGLRVHVTTFERLFDGPAEQQLATWRAPHGRINVKSALALIGDARDEAAGPALPLIHTTAACRLSSIMVLLAGGAWFTFCSRGARRSP